MRDRSCRGTSWGGGNAERLYWPGCSEAVGEQCKGLGCIRCACNEEIVCSKTKSKPSNCLCYHNGPLPETEKGSKYILHVVAVDCFTKWVGLTAFQIKKYETWVSVMRSFVTMIQTGTVQCANYKPSFQPHIQLAVACAYVCFQEMSDTLDEASGGKQAANYMYADIVHSGVKSRDEKGLYGSGTILQCVMAKVSSQYIMTAAAYSI